MGAKAARLFDDPLDGGHRRDDLSLSEAQQLEPGRRLASVAARFSVGALGRGELAAESMQLAELVQRRADGGMPRFAQVSESVLRGLGGIRPRSVRLQHL